MKRLLPRYVLSGLLLMACPQQAAPPPATPPPKVTVSQPLSREVVEWEEYTGRLEAVESVEVRARVSGYRQSVNFTEGGLVKQGDWLFVVDPGPYQAELQRARAELAMAAARLEHADKDFARAQMLLRSRAMSEEVDTRSFARRQAQEAVQAARAMVEAAQLNVEFTQVCAPISGCAVVEACRLRPILMTSFAFIPGVTPLVIAQGPGAEMRQAPGISMFSGMLGVTFLGLLLTPVFYVVIRWFTERRQQGQLTPQARHVLPCLALGLGLLGPVSGCTPVGPNYREPVAQVPSGFANQDQPGISTAAVEVAWWRGFQEDKLDQLVAQALAGNHNLRIATARLREARAVRGETQLNRFPIVTAQGEYTRERRSQAVVSASGERDTELYHVGFDASWELDFFGRVRRSLEASSADVGAAEAARRDVMVSLLAEVARNYFELRGAQNQLAVARRNAENQRQLLELTQALLDAGRGTELDVSRAEAQLNTTLASIPPLQTTISRAMYRLGVLIGAVPTALVQDLSAPLPLPGSPELVALGQPADLLRRRPDIRVAERNLAAATARIGVATADLFPRVTLLGSVGLEASSFTGLGKGGNDTFAIGPSIFWAAFDLGRVRARIRAADARTEAALAQYEQQVLLALEETENSLVDFNRQQARRDLLRASAQASEKAAALARLRYQSGVADFLTVLDAERVLLEAQDRLADSETRTATALIAVYKALGGGWEQG